MRAGLAVYDTMQSSRFGVQTLNLGIAASIRWDIIHNTCDTKTLCFVSHFCLAVHKFRAQPLSPNVTLLTLLPHPDFSGFLCGAGDKGKRMALPNARFLLQTPKLEDMGLSQVSRSQTEAAFTIGRCEYKFG